MYCVNCGVKLSDTEKACPLCATVPYHPDIKRGEAEPLYPENTYPYQKQKKITRTGIMMILTAVFALTMFITLLCDFQINRGVVWSGFVVGAILVYYSSFVLPFWFKKPNAVIFTPTSFLSVLLYLLYINLATHGSWFMSFAFPTVTILAFIITATVTLLKYLKRGKLYVYGAFMIALGGFTPLLELFITSTFDFKFIWWSLYSLVPLTLIGLALIFFAISPSARESMERRFFL